MTAAFYTWSCGHCGTQSYRYSSASERDRHLIKHTSRCRRCPSGTEVRNARNGKLLYRKR